MKNFSINARVRAVRKSKGLSQAEFGKAISLKQGGVSYIEQEGNTVTEQNIALICQHFNVRRAWLVDGEGEMQDSPENSLFATFAKEYKLTPAEQNAARFLLTLSSEERQQMLKYVTMLANAIHGNTQPQSEAGAAKGQQKTLDPERAALHQELDEALNEKEAASAASASKDSSAKWA